MFKQVGELGAYTTMGDPVPVGEDKPAVFRLYTRRDCGAIYDLMREHYPELDDYWLLVRMVPETEFRMPEDKRVLAAKRIDTSNIAHPEGEHPMAEVCWKGERPRFPYREGASLMSLVGDPEDITKESLDTEKVAMAMEVFGEKRMPWKTAKEGTSVTDRVPGASR